MTHQKSMSREAIDLVLMTALTYLGFHLFFYLWWGAPGIGFANAWTKRLLMMGALGIAASSSLFVINNFLDSIKIFLVTWVVLITCMFLAGGGYAIYDASGPVDINNAWLAYDAGDFGIGVNFQLITNSAVVIMAIASLGLILFQVNYAEKGTEQMKAILKGVVTSGFLYLFYTQIFPIVM